MIWLLAGLGVLAAGAVALVWALCSLSSRLSRAEIMAHYLDDD